MTHDNYHMLRWGGVRTGLKQGVGKYLHRLYMRLRYRDGRVTVIEDGLLKGVRIRQYVRTVTGAFANGTYEQWLQDQLARELKRGDTFFDVGANGGFFSLLAARLVGPEGTVVGFEPHPDTARQAEAQLKANAFHHARIVRAAVSDAEGFAFFTDGETSVVQRLTGLPGAENVAHSQIRVATTTLDAAILRHGLPQVVKIDIEGAELFALRGARKLLRTKKTVIMLEIHSELLYREIRPMLQGFGFNLFRVCGEPVGDEYVRFVVARPNE